MKNNEKVTKEIKDLQEKLIEARITNLIRVIKKVGLDVQAFAPYLLSAGVVTGGFAAVGMTPFYRDNIKEYAFTKTTFDSNRNISEEKQYNMYDNAINKLFCYGKWVQNADGSYSRTIVTYDVKKKTYAELLELVEQEEINMENLLGNPESTKVETKNSLTEEELNSEPYVQALVYDMNKNDFYVIKETVGQNVFETIVYLVFLLVIESLVMDFREKTTGFDYLARDNWIDKEYPKMDTKELSKELKRVRKRNQ